MKAIFVTGTDTGVGKTVVTGLVARYIQEMGYNVITQKWIQSGSSLPKDINLHLRLMRKKKDYVKRYFNYVCPYIFKFPSSPHLASIIEKKRISAKEIKRSFNQLSNIFDFVVVEGIGGALVPYNKKGLVIDIAKELKLPTLIVAANKLGAINHTLLTVEALRKRKLKILGIVFNNLKKENVILKDNPKIIKKVSRETILGVLPYRKNKNFLYKHFLPMGRRLAGLLNLENNG